MMDYGSVLLHAGIFTFTDKGCVVSQQAVNDIKTLLRHKRYDIDNQVKDFAAQYGNTFTVPYKRALRKVISEYLDRKLVVNKSDKSILMLTVESSLQREWDKELFNEFMR